MAYWWGKGRHRTASSTPTGSAAGSARNDAAETTRRRGNASEPPRLRLPLPDDDVFRRAVAKAHADGHAGLVGGLQPLAQAPRLDDAAPPGRAFACVSRSRRWCARLERRSDGVVPRHDVVASHAEGDWRTLQKRRLLKKADAGKDRRARACRRTARPRVAARRGPLREYDGRTDGVFMGYASQAKPTGPPAGSALGRGPGIAR